MGTGVGTDDPHSDQVPSALLAPLPDWRPPQASPPSRPPVLRLPLPPTGAQAQVLRPVLVLHVLLHVHAAVRLPVLGAGPEAAGLLLPLHLHQPVQLHSRHGVFHGRVSVLADLRTRAHASLQAQLSERRGFSRQKRRSLSHSASQLLACSLKCKRDESCPGLEEQADAGGDRQQEQELGAALTTLRLWLQRQAPSLEMGGQTRRESLEEGYPGKKRAAEGPQGCVRMWTQGLDG